MLKKHRRVCVECLTGFTATIHQSTKVYCSNRCSNAVQRRRAAERHLQVAENGRIWRGGSMSFPERDRAARIRASAVPLERTSEKGRLIDYIVRRHELYKSDAYLEILSLKLKLYEPI